MAGPAKGITEFYLMAKDEGGTPHRLGRSFSNSIPDHLPVRYDMDSPTVTYPWMNDNNCSRFATRLGKDLPRLYLFSFPRSGSTWLRYLLEGATGFFTGSEYRSELLFKLGFLGEFEDPLGGRTLFIKAKLWDNQTFTAESDPSLLLIRNPMNVILSLASYEAAKRNMSYGGSEKDFQISDGAFKSYVEDWERVTTLPLKHCRYLHIVVYENLKVDLMTEIFKIMKFFILPGYLHRMACLAQHAERPVNRDELELYPFSEEQNATVAEAVERVNALVLRRGFPQLPFAEPHEIST